MTNPAPTAASSSNTPAYEKVVDTTSNTLNNFDIVVSIAESSINEQLKDAWEKWNAEKDGVAVIKEEKINPMFEEDKDGVFLELSLGAPTVTLSDPSGKLDLTQVNVSFQVVSGTVYQRDRGRYVVTLDLAGRELSFTSALQKQGVALTELYALSNKAGEVVARLTAAHQGGAGAFTIECLYLNLNATDFISGFDLSKPQKEEDILKKLTFSEGYPPKIASDTKNRAEKAQSLADEAEHLIKKYFDARRKKHSYQKGRFLVSTSVRPRVPTRESSFPVSDLRFKVTRCRPGSPTQFPSSLDYLGVVDGGLPMPAEGQPLEKARADLGSWLTASRVTGEKALAAGVMALRGAKVHEVLSNSLRRAIPLEFTRMEKKNKEEATKLGKPSIEQVEKPEVQLSYPEYKLFSGATIKSDDVNRIITIESNDSNNTYNWTGDEGDGKIKFHLRKSLKLTLTPMKHECYSVSGQYEIYLKRDRGVFLGSQDAKATVAAPINGTVVFNAVSTGLKCDIRPVISVTMDTAKVAADADASNFLLGWFGNNKGDKNKAEGFVKAIKNKIESMLIESFRCLNLHIKDFAIIPPGEEAFTFSRPRFSQNGDLLLDIVYRAVIG